VIYLKFKIGEKVRIKTFENGFYHWVPAMKDFAGEIVTIKSIRKSTTLPYNIHGCYWSWQDSDFEKTNHLPEELFEI
jgi:hypothetical protein